MKKRYYNAAMVVLSVLLLAYLASWIVMPRLGKSLEISFDDSCYTGTIKWFDAQGSTCSSGQSSPIGFPFAVHHGSAGENVLTAILDFAPALLLAMTLTWLYRRANEND